MFSRRVASVLSCSDRHLLVSSMSRIRLFSNIVGNRLIVDNPYTGETTCEVPLMSVNETKKIVDQSVAVQREWRQTTLEQRIDLCNRFMETFEQKRDQIAREITDQMGKPLSQAQNEVNGMYQRTKKLIEMAPEALKEDQLASLNDGRIIRSIRKEAVGSVLVIAPWNYPLLTAVNAVIPAILAGNSVVLKHSIRTPLTGNAFVNAFDAAGAPKNLVSAIQCTNEITADVIRNPNIAFVSFTGSVPGGRAVYKTVAERFIDATLELGGKDPAYVAEDANIEAAIETLVDGAMYNAGQSCCGIERIYVHRSLHQKFVDGAVAAAKAYKLGNPLDKDTSMGPIAQPHQPIFLKQQVDQARSLGARVLYGGSPVTDASGKGRFFAPTVVTECNHSMELMTEESFGPIVGIQAVDSDAEALKLMNDSQYGLTACVFTQDQSRMLKMANDLQCGTVFMNRCDYLDPELPWTGVKNTGKGVSLSKYAFRGFTRMKGIHIKLLQ